MQSSYLHTLLPHNQSTEEISHMGTPSVTNITPLLKSLAITTKCLLLQQTLVEDTLRAVLSDDYDKSAAHTKIIEVIFLVSDTLRESMRENEKLLITLKGV